MLEIIKISKMHMKNISNIKGNGWMDPGKMERKVYD